MRRLAYGFVVMVFGMGAISSAFALTHPIRYDDFSQAEAVLVFTSEDVARNSSGFSSRVKTLNHATVLSGGDLEFPLQIHNFRGVLSEVAEGQILMFLDRDERSGQWEPVNGMFSILPLRGPIEQLERGKGAQGVIDSYLIHEFPQEQSRTIASLQALLLEDAPAEVQRQCWKAFSAKEPKDEEWALIHLHCGLHAEGIQVLQAYPRKFWRIDHLGVEENETDILLSRLRSGIRHWLCDYAEDGELELVVEFVMEQRGDYRGDFFISLLPHLGPEHTGLMVTAFSEVESGKELYGCYRAIRQCLDCTTRLPGSDAFNANPKPYLVELQGWAEERGISLSF